MRHRHSGYLYIICIALSLWLFSCKGKEEKPTPAPPVKVKVLEIAKENGSNTREYSGTVVAAQSTSVSFSVPGTITQLLVQEGQKVHKGQMLAKIRNGEYLNAYNIAEAQLAEAQDGYNRLKKLHDANALPEVKWVEMEQKLKQAQNAADMAARTLNDANLSSPVDGTVTRKFADVGQNVLPAQPIFEIISSNDLEIEVSVAENEVADFFVGQPASINLSSENIPAIKGKVVSKAIVADPLTRTYTVKVGIPGKNINILPGMTGNVRFEQTKDDRNENSGINLPSGAVLLNDDNRWFVWVVKDSVSERRFVEADELSSSGVLVKKGLEPGDMVIVEGVQKVGTGTKVTY